MHYKNYITDENGKFIHNRKQRKMRRREAFVYNNNAKIKLIKRAAKLKARRGQ